MNVSVISTGLNSSSKQNILRNSFQLPQQNEKQTSWNRQNKTFEIMEWIIIKIA